MTARPSSALVVGDALVDILVRPAAPIRPGADVPADVRIEPGGQGANLAVRLARRGVATRLVCALGDDPAGEIVRRALAADGVTITALPATVTGSVVVLVGPDGDRTMLSHRASFVSAVRALPDADWVVVSGYALAEPDAISLAGRMPAGSRRAVVGCAVADDAADAWRAAVRALAPDLVILNRDEAALAPAGPIVVVTEAGGVEASQDGRAVARVLGHPIPALDTTGAGDAFAAALLAGLPVSAPLDTASLERGMARALEAAAAVTRAIGAQARTAGEAPSGVPR